MFRHRLAPEADYYRLPEPPAPTVQPTGFVLCTVAVLPAFSLMQWAGMQTIYVQAFEQALTAARPSLLDRDLFAFWN
jgi:hypothetical protein